MEFINGEDREQSILFPDSLDSYIDKESAVRIIDAFIDSLNLFELGFARYEPNDTGRPAYDPRCMLKLYVYGYMNRIRSSRRLENESKRNLEVMWLLEKLMPDHKTIANFRKDNKKSLKNVFKSFVKLCMGLDLYGKELVAIDGSKFKAVNSKDRNFNKDKLKDRLKNIDERIEEYMNEIDKADREEGAACAGKTAAEIDLIIKNLKERKKRYEAIGEELEKTGETQKSLTDPESRLMLSNGKMDVCYNVQTAVDAKNKLIVDFEVTNNANDFNQLAPMAEKAMETLEVKAISVAADKGYDRASDIAAAAMMGVDVHVSGTDVQMCVPAGEGEQAEITSQHGGRSVYLKDRNIALCPMGKTLYPHAYRKSTGKAAFMNSEACRQCACRCTKAEVYIYQFVMNETEFSKDYCDNDLAVKQIHIKARKEISAQRKCIVEHPFGTVKRNMDAGYCLLKGKAKVTAEFSLVFLAYNLKRVINIVGIRKLIDYFINNAFKP